MPNAPHNQVSRIVIAVDGSDRAPHVLDAGFALASAHGAAVTVLRVVGVPLELPSAALSMAPDALVDTMLSDAETDTRALLAARGADAQVRVETGAPVTTILRVANEVSADVIVMGAHGYRFAERMLGTTVSRVVDRATQSVLVVR